jgi:hypothetical protein
MSVVQSSEVGARQLAVVPRSDLELERKGHQMSVHMVEAKIRRESVTDVQAAAEKMFAAINAAQPEGIRYASSLLPDGETFVALLQVDDGVKNPLLGFPRIPRVLGRCGGLACQAGQLSTADDHRLVPVVLKAQGHAFTGRRSLDNGVSDESVCGRCDGSHRTVSWCHVWWPRVMRFMA